VSIIFLNVFARLFLKPLTSRDGVVALAFLFVVLIGVIARYALTDIYERLGLDTEHLEKKHMFGHGFAMFATWVAVLTLLSNPPMSDFDEPHIEGFKIYQYDSDTGYYNETSSPSEDAVIQIRVKIMDNGKLEKESLRLELSINDRNEALDANQSRLKRLNGTDDPVYVGLEGYVLEVSGEYEVRIFAEDSFGNQRVRTFIFQVS